MELLDLADHFDLGLPEWRHREGSAALSEEELERCAAFVDTNGFSWGYYGQPREQAELPLPDARTLFVTEVTEDEPATPSDSQ